MTSKFQHWRCFLNRYALLCGSAPVGFSQKKINEIHDFLVSSSGGSFSEAEIAVFPNGVSEEMLSFAVENLAAQRTERILLYICTLEPCRDFDESVFLNGEEIHTSVIKKLSDFPEHGIDFQVIYDWDKETVSDEVLYSEKY